MLRTEAVDILQGLNPEQIQAVTSDSPTILCLAGAGSGKTAVLTRRIAYLHREKRVGTSNMLALTFTRLAGKEMKERIMALIGEEQGGKLFCHTFHAFCVHVLREWGHLVGIERGFTIYDQEDRDAIIGQIITEFGYGDKVKIYQVVTGDAENDGPVAKVTAEYLYRLRQNNAVDLDLLLLKARQVLAFFVEARYHYQRLYTHVFVDEFQDTNDVQMDIIRRLQPEHLFVVGDDFQSIYGWRGANVENILRFPAEYPACEVIKLEQNYRSSREIVDAANRLIAHNERQTQKVLRAEKEGPWIRKRCHKYPADEARWVAEEARKIVGQTEASWSDIALLARTNKQLSDLVPEFTRLAVPHLVVNSQQDVWAQHDIRCLVAALQAARNPEDAHSLKKLLKFPIPRLPQLAYEELDYRVTDSGLPLYMLLPEVAEKHPGVRDLLSIIDTMASWDPTAVSASLAFASTYELFKLKEYYGSRGLQNRFDDLKQAYNAILRWEKVQTVLGESVSADAFLRWLRVKDVQEKLVQEETDAVRLMTVHASKGLEFDTVFLIGLNQGIFPSKHTEDMEEERRLMYVAVTRAKRRLILSYPEMRTHYSYTMEMEESQFIKELCPT